MLDVVATYIIYIQILGVTILGYNIIVKDLIHKAKTLLA